MLVLPEGFQVLFFKFPDSVVEVSICLIHSVFMLMDIIHTVTKLGATKFRCDVELGPNVKLILAEYTDVDCDISTC